MSVHPQQPGSSGETIDCMGQVHSTPESDIWNPTMPSQIKTWQCCKIGQGYSTLSSNIICFIELDELPVPIDIGCLGEGSDIEATLLEHRANWHKSCHWKFSTMKLQRAEKRKAAIGNSDTECPIAKKYTHTKDLHERDAKDICFFVRLHQHQNHSMKYQLFKWILEFVSVLMFCKTNGYLQNLVLKIWSGCTGC